MGDLKTIFEFELFGTGVDSGQTTFRLRHAWGELGAFGAGQYWSPFTDPDAFPNSLEYWGPTGLAWYRNVQVRWTPIRDDNNSLMIALERPGASGDQGVYADRIELQGIKARFPLPDFSAAYKYSEKWGYVRVAAQLREIKWDDTLDDNLDLSGDATGWGHGELRRRRPRRPFGRGAQPHRPVRRHGRSAVPAGAAARDHDRRAGRGRLCRPERDHPDDRRDDGHEQSE